MLAAVGVAGITRPAFVHIAGNVIVLFGRVLSRVADRAGELSKVTRHVTRVAVTIVGPAEGEPVVEAGLGPARMVRGMAQLAIRGKTRGNMVGIARASVVIRMAPVTVFGQVVTLTVTFLAIQASVGSAQSEEAIVIEISTLPTVCGVSVARFTVPRETGLLMIRSGRSIVVVHVAGGAILGGPGIHTG